MPDLNAILEALHLDFISLLLVIIVYWVTNILKEKYKLSRPDVRGTALLLGIAVNGTRALFSGITFPSGLPVLGTALVIGCAMGIVATGSHKLMKLISQRTGMPLYEDPETDSPVIIQHPPAVERVGPDPALASTPEHTVNEV